jgi:hypothetical protein
MRKLLRELRRTFPDAEIRTTGSNHYAVRLPSGRVVIVSNSLSCRFFLHRARADARRLSRSNPDESKGGRP